MLGLCAEVSKEIKERPPCTACKGIRGCMAVGGGSRADVQWVGARGRSPPSHCPASSNLQDAIILPAGI